MAWIPLIHIKASTAGAICANPTATQCRTEEASPCSALSCRTLWRIHDRRQTCASATRPSITALRLKDDPCIPQIASILDLQRCVLVFYREVSEGHTSVRRDQNTPRPRFLNE